MNLDLGGIGHQDGWVTVNVDDSGYRSAPDIVADISASAAQLDAHFEAGSVDVIRCIHTLEHIAHWDLQPTLVYWRKFLKAGGELLIVVPDLGKMARDFCEGAIPFDVLASVTYVTGWRTKRSALEEHRWGWNFETLCRDLTEAGYSEPHEASEYVDSWIYDYADMQHTGCVWNYRVPNLRVRCNA